MVWVCLACSAGLMLLLRFYTAVVCFTLFSEGVEVHVCERDEKRERGREREREGGGEAL